MMIGRGAGEEAGGKVVVACLVDAFPTSIALTRQGVVWRMILKTDVAVLRHASIKHHQYRLSHLTNLVVTVLL